MATNSCEMEQHDNSTNNPSIQLGQTAVNSFNSPLDEEFHFQLPDDLFLEWPLDLGHGEAFTFLGQDLGQGLS